MTVVAMWGAIAVLVFLGAWCMVGQLQIGKEERAALNAADVELMEQFGSRHPELASDQFEAYTYCPGCGRNELHGMREPKPAPTKEYVQAWAERRARAIERGGIETVTVASWGSLAPVRKVEIIPGFHELEPLDRESMWSTIRQCECGHEWGQK